MIKLLTLLKEVLLEGGNVFGTTAPIAKEDIEPTLHKFVEELSKIFPAKATTFNSFEKLGSAGKKPLSGDIDLSYDVKNIFPDHMTPDFEGWGVSEAEYKALVDKFTKSARTASPEKIALRAMIVLIGTKINNESNVIRADLKQSGGGSIFCETGQYNEEGEELGKTVQTDINIGNPEWLRFSYYSQTYSGTVKGLHRTQLMLSMFAEKNRTFNHATGVVDKETGQQEATNPKEAVALLNKLYGFKGKLTQDILDDYYKLEEFLKNNASKQVYNSIMDRYLKILDSTRADIPENLQDYWIQNQDRLGLKGKFLPDNSNLAQYKKEA